MTSTNLSGAVKRCLELWKVPFRAGGELHHCLVDRIVFPRCEFATDTEMNGRLSGQRGE